MARLFTVEITAHTIPHVGRDFAGFTVYECDFAGIHFSRTAEEDVIKWVRIAAINRYGKDTQVLFVHPEGNDTP